MTKTKTFVPLLVEMERGLARSTAAQVQAAMLLLIYCNKKRNGGRIPRALVEDRMELATIILAGLKGALEHDCELFHWDGDTLVVDCYSVAHEEKAAKNAERMAELSEARWKRCKTNRKARAKCDTHSATHSATECVAECRQDKTRRQSSCLNRQEKTDKTTDTDTSLSLSGRPDSNGQAVVNQPDKEAGQETAPEVMTDEELTAGFDEIRRELD